MISLRIDDEEGHKADLLRNFLQTATLATEQQSVSNEVTLSLSIVT